MPSDSQPVKLSSSLKPMEQFAELFKEDLEQSSTSLSLAIGSTFTGNRRTLVEPLVSSKGLVNGLDQAPLSVSKGTPIGSLVEVDACYVPENTYDLPSLKNLECSFRPRQ